MCMDSKPSIYEMSSVDIPTTDFLDELVRQSLHEPGADDDDHQCCSMQTMRHASSEPQSNETCRKLLPCTSILLCSTDCQLLSPCLTARHTNRLICVRSATIKDAEGLWIRLELKHSMQTLLDSCGNGKVSWLQVAMRLDLANTLKMDPAHLKIISLEQRDVRLVILQVLLTQPPDSVLSLANVGDKLHTQAQHYLRRTRKPQQELDAKAHNQHQPAADTVTKKVIGKLSRSAESGVSLAETKITTSTAFDANDLADVQSAVFIRTPSAQHSRTKKMGGGTRYFDVPNFRGKDSLRSGSLRVSGEALKDRQRAVHLLQLVESVEVKAGGPVVRRSSNWCVCLYSTLFILTLTSVTYDASAFKFGMVSTGMPLRSAPADSAHAAATLNKFDNTMFTLHSSLAGGGGVRRGGALTQLHMLEPMTFATLCLTAASTIWMSKAKTASKLSARLANSRTQSQVIDDEDVLLLRKLDPVVLQTDSSKSHEASHKQHRREEGARVSRSKSWEDMGTQTIVAVSASTEIVKRRALHAVKTFQGSDSHALRNRASARLGSINHDIAEQLDDEMSPESMFLEDTMESVLDRVDAIYKQTTTLVSHHAHSASHATHTLMSPSAHHASEMGQAASHLAPFFQHKAQILDGLTSVVHVASVIDVGGMASAGVTLGLATVAVHVSSRNQV